jgi:hypothetical protein
MTTGAIRTPLAAGSHPLGYRRFQRARRPARHRRVAGASKKKDRRGYAGLSREGYKGIA